MITQCFTCSSHPVISPTGVYCPRCRSWAPSLAYWNRLNTHLNLVFFSSISLVALALLTLTALLTYHVFLIRSHPL